MAIFEAGNQIGQWKLLELLGEGGNGEVWRAAHDDDTPIALKIVFHDDPYYYKRFAAEIQVLRHIGHRPGILPLLDAHLPDNPNKNDPAWLAMPIAIGIKNALNEEPLEVVVEAISIIAHTLASLAKEN